MGSQGVKRVSATEAKVHLGELLQEVARSDQPVIIQTRGQDRAVLISYKEFQTRQFDKQRNETPEHISVRETLRQGGLLSEPTALMLHEAAEYDARYTAQEQQEILADLRNLALDPALSQVIIENRNWPSTPSEGADE